MMRKIRQRERDNGMRYCTFCKQATHAIWRSQRRGISLPIQFACEDHKGLIEDGDRIASNQEPQPDSGRMTEADYQTWHQL
jgi:hypothetical protein